MPTSGPHATYLPSSSALPNAALALQPLRSSLRVASPVVSAFTPPPAVPSPAFPALPDSTLLSLHSAASSIAPRIGVRDVAELVRHLAESRYITRQLQQRVRQMESSFNVNATALGDSTMSDAHAQRSTTAAAQAAGERLATSGEAEADTAAVHVPPPDSRAREATTRGGRRRCTANERGSAPPRPASSTCVRASKRTSSVSAATRQSRADNSRSPRSPHRGTSSLTSSFAATASTNASATSSSLPSTSPSTSIAESPVGCGLPSPSSRRAPNRASSAASSRHGRRIASRRQHGPRRTHSALERPRHRRRSSFVNRHHTITGASHKSEQPRHRSSAAHHRARTRSQKRHHRKAHLTDGYTTPKGREGDEARHETHAAPASLVRRYRRSSVTRSRRHRRIRRLAAEAARCVRASRSPPPPAALPALKGTRGLSFTPESTRVWQRRFYDLLARCADERKRRDADLADIHEMIECISWEQEQSQHSHRQRHHTRTVECEAEGSTPLPLRHGAASHDCAQGIVGEAGAASDELAVATPQVVAHTADGGNMRIKDDVGGPRGHATAGDAAIPVHDSLEYVEVLRCEADAWRQRCLTLLQQQRLGAEATWASDASVAPLPQRPSSAAAGRPPLLAFAAPTSSEAEALMSVNTSTMADVEAVAVHGGADGACERDSFTAAAHLIDCAVHSKPSRLPLPSYASTPVSVAARVAQRPSPSASPAEAAVGAAPSSAHQVYHPYAPPRPHAGSHVPSAVETTFDASFPTPPLVTPSRLAASSSNPSPARPPLFVGVPGYASLITHTASHAAWPRQLLSAPPPSGNAPRHSNSPGVAFPAITSVFPGAPSFDAGASATWGDVGRSGASQDHEHASSITSHWLLDATRSHQRQMDLSASPPVSTPETLLPCPHSFLSHKSPPSSSKAAELVVAREQLERDIRRHDQLLKAIGKLQKTAAEHATRRAL
ncbi:hypothetical protein LSCM1_05706 [Leishmania martiniquensis]|uniref:Uncharacterized protein n=1 Tax=Leishmania martiniquensis TaxID=1580590 RepID=A0A836HSV0_9TRYP|nr:hypothetical protein LSCM1_05706 [Leishmania martiniquensis]